MSKVNRHLMMKTHTHSRTLASVVSLSLYHSSVKLSVGCQCTGVWPICGVFWSPSSPYSVPVSGLSVVSPGLLPLPTVYMCLTCLWCILSSSYSVPVSGLSVVSPTSPYSVPVSGLSVVSPGLLPLPTVYQCLACLWCLLVSFLSLQCTSVWPVCGVSWSPSSPYSVPVSGLSVVSPGLLPLPTVYQCLACLWCLLVSFLSLQCTSVWPVCGVSWSPSSPYSVPVSGLSVVSPGLLPLPTVYQCLACLWCLLPLPTVYQCLTYLWCLLVSLLSLQCTSVWPVCGVSYLSLQCTSV